MTDIAVHESRKPQHRPQDTTAILDHPVRGRINAWFFHLMDWYMHRKYAELKTRLYRDLPPTVLDLGAGSGASMRYLQRGSKVIAVEPNPHMHGFLARRAAAHGLAIDIHAAGGEAMPLEDASVDAVICSLVLCTVPDPEATAREVRRVLRPGGRFICIEHVADPPDTWVGRIQRWVFRPWRWFFEGCHTHRDTEQTLRAAGFSKLHVERFRWASAFVPVRPQIAAVAVK